MLKIKDNWNILVIELLSILLATLVFSGSIPFSFLLLFLILLPVLALQRSIFTVFLLCFVALFLFLQARTRKMSEEPELYLHESMDERLVDLSVRISDRVAADESLLVSVGGQILESGSDLEDPDLGIHVFDIIASKLEREQGVGVILFDTGLRWVAWGGRIRGINAGFIRETLDTGENARIVKGSVFTVLTMTYPLTGTDGEPIGVLFLCDLLAVQGNLEQVASMQEGFLDGLSGGLGRWGVLAPAESGGEKEGAKPVTAFGKRVAWLLPPAGKDVAELSSPVDRIRIILCLLIFIPWLMVTRRWICRIDGLIQTRLRQGNSQYLWLFAGTVAIGLILSLLRRSLIALGIPGDFWDSALFSPNLFASGLLDAASRSVGDFFISTVFILVLACWFLIRVRTISIGTRGLISSISRITVVSAAVILSASVPFVLQRLLRDTSTELLVYGRPFESLAFILWEGSLCLLLLGVLLVSTGLFITAAGKVKKTIPLAVAMVALGGLYFLPVFRPGQGMTAFNSILLPIAAVSVSFLLANIITGQSHSANVTRSLGSFLMGTMCATLIMYPFILDRRYEVLIESAEELAEVARKPIDTWITYVLEEFIEETQEKQDKILDEFSSRELAFALWAASPLSTVGTPSSLSIYDMDGNRLSTFSLLAGQLPAEVVSYLADEAGRRGESFIYTGFVGDEQYYIATVPLGTTESMSGVLLARLPTGLKRRIKTGVTPFLRTESRFRPASGISVSLIEEEDEIPAELREAVGRGVWQKHTDDPGEGKTYLASVTYIQAEQRWLLLGIPLMNVGMLLGMTVAAVLVNCVVVAIAIGLFFSFCVSSVDEPLLFFGRGFYGTFRVRLTIALFIFSLIPTLIWGVLSREALIERLDKDTRMEAQRILRDSIPLLLEDGGRSDQEGTEAPVTISLPFPGDERMADLAEVMGAELFLYSGNMLISSSRPDLIQSGIMAPWTGSKAYRELFLEHRSTTSDLIIIGSTPYIMVYRRLRVGTGFRELTLATPMLLRQEEIKEEVAELDYNLLVAVMTILGGSILLGLFVASFLSKPLGELRRGTRQIASGNLDYQLEGGSFSEFQELYESFNEMASRVKDSHLLLVSEKSKIETILKNVGAGVLVLDRDGDLKLSNEMAAALLSIDMSGLTGMSLTDSPLIPVPWRIFVLWAADPEQRGEKQFEITVDDGRVFIRGTKTVVKTADGESLSVVIFEDVTEGIRSQRVLAWADMARQIAHEIKNPLTPIRLAVQHVRRLYRDRAPDFEEKLEENVNLILREIERLGKTASQFSTLAKADRTRAAPIDIGPLVREVLALYKDGEEHITYELVCDREITIAVSNEEDFRKVLINLLENSRDAVKGGGVVTVSLGENDGWVVLSVNDTGEGIPSDLLGKVFEPDFTTRTDGTGLGLTIVRRLVEGWGGRVEIDSVQDVSTRVSVFMKPA